MLLLTQPTNLMQFWLIKPELLNAKYCQLFGSLMFVFVLNLQKPSRTSKKSCFSSESKWSLWTFLLTFFILLQTFLLLLLDSVFLYLLKQQHSLLSEKNNCDVDSTDWTSAGFFQKRGGFTSERREEMNLFGRKADVLLSGRHGDRNNDQ